jgi:hypothetical protein
LGKDLGVTALKKSAGYYYYYGGCHVDGMMNVNNPEPQTQYYTSSLKYYINSDKTAYIRTNRKLMQKDKQKITHHVSEKRKVALEIN